MTNNFKSLVLHIRDNINQIEETLSGSGFEDFHTDRKKIISVVQSFEEIISAVNSIENDKKLRYTFIPWTQIEDLKYNLCKSDFGIDAEEVWRTAKHDLKKIGKSIDQLWDELKKGIAQVSTRLLFFFLTNHLMLITITKTMNNIRTIFPYMSRKWSATFQF